MKNSFQCMVWGLLRFPVVRVSWNDANAFCAWATAKTKRRVRLPTEAEWEYACRAGTTSRLFFGNNESALGAYGWTIANSGSRTHPVGQKKPNPWGLFDVYGNVWELCQDWPGPYSAGAVTDPMGAETGGRRCMRGGSWADKSGASCSTCRGKFPPTWNGVHIGFRVAVSP